MGRQQKNIILLCAALVVLGALVGVFIWQQNVQRQAETEAAAQPTEEPVNLKLIEHSQDEIVKVEFFNEKGSFTMLPRIVDEAVEWYIEEYPELALNTSTASSQTLFARALNASSLMLETLSNPTEYGTLIHSALEEYVLGNYERSAGLWEQVLVYNTNYDLAYIGLGRALLRQERYEEAMYYFKLKYDFANYSKAYQQYRKIAVEDNIGFIIVGIFTLIILWNTYRIVRRIRKGAAENAAG